MKNTKFLLGMAGFCFATMVLFSCGSGGENTSGEADTTVQSLMAADTNTLDQYAISYQTAENDINAFGDHFRKAGGGDVKNMETVDLAKLTALINDYNSSAQDVTRGVKLSYGYENNKVICLFSAVTKDASGTISVDNKYSKWNGSDFETANANLIDAYKNSVEVLRATGGSWTKVKDDWDTSAHSNAQATFRSLDELTRLAADNGNVTTLYFFTTAREIDSIFKQDIVISAVQNINPAIPQGTSGFENSADDYHNPCPNMCAF